MGIKEINIKYQLPRFDKHIPNDLNSAFNYAGYQTDSIDKYVLKFSKIFLEPHSHLTLEIVLGPEQDGPQTPFWITFYYQIRSHGSLNTENTEKDKKLLEAEAQQILQTIK